MAERLTLDELRSTLRYEPESGVFVWLTSTARGQSGTEAGTVRPDGYRIITIAGRRFYAHRLAWLYMTGEWPALVDHRDLDTSNNRWSNLREADKSKNGATRGASKANKVGLKGVWWQAHAKKWTARVFLGDGRRYRSVGYFDTPEAAHAAYVAASEKQHGEFARAA